MAIFAQLENNLVVNVIIADNLEWVNDNLDGTWLEITEETRNAGIGYSYNAERNLFLNPEPIPNLGFDEEKYEWVVEPWVRPVFE